MPPRVFLFADDLDLIAGEVLASPSFETGGSLFGHVLRSGDVLVYRVTGPGPLARHARTAFYPDAAFMADAGRALFPAEHVGEYHSHHRLGLEEPSASDIDSVRRVLAARGWGDLLLGIANLKAGQASIGFWRVTGAGEPEPCAIEKISRRHPLGEAALPGEVRRERARNALMLRQPGLRPAPWFTRDPAARRIAAEVQAFGRAGYDVVSRLVGDEVRIDVSDGEEEFRVSFAPGYPARPAAVARTSRTQVATFPNSEAVLATQLGAVELPSGIPKLPRLPGVMRRILGSSVSRRTAREAAEGLRHVARWIARVPAIAEGEDRHS